MKNLIKALLLSTITIIGLFMFTGMAAGDVKTIKGQTLYVPCYTSYISVSYSHNLNATVFIHNTDPSNEINLVRIDYYNTGGKLVKKCLPQPLKLNPLAATRFTIQEPLTGEDGAVAHLIVQWKAEKKVVEPLIDAWFLASAGTRGYSFTSQARIIQEDAN